MMIVEPRGRGYTLIEVLVAMVILALTLTVIFRIFSGGLHKIGVATDYTRAVMVAESVLAATGNTERLIAGETSGRLLDQYRWSRSVTRFPSGTAVSSQRNKLVNAYQVSVVVKWPARDGFRNLNLTTLKLAENFPAEGRK
jgi:general secretion pathway protein I